jgi:HrpA-like RNA helicase
LHEDSLDTIQKERRELPIYEFRDEIVSMVRENLYCIITGETGSGKST